MSALLSQCEDKLAPLMEFMAGLRGRPELDDVVSCLRELEITVQDLGAYVQFNGRNYRRNLIFENEHVQLLCLCWKSGQRSLIHDHAESICGVKVVSGVASETRFEMTPSGYVKPVSTVDYGKGVVGSADDDIHQIANFQGDNEDLITLHCYSPPLKRMKTFATDSTAQQIYEPINEWHIDGSGI